MTALAERTVEVMPLGLRGRYSLTPALQRIYLACVAITDEGAMPNLYSIKAKLGRPGTGSLHEQLLDLQERRWITVDREWCARRTLSIRLVEPVLRHLIPAA